MQRHLTAMRRTVTAARHCKQLRTQAAASAHLVAVTFCSKQEIRGATGVSSSIALEIDAVTEQISAAMQKSDKACHGTQLTVRDFLARNLASERGEGLHNSSPA